MSHAQTLVVPEFTPTRYSCDPFKPGECIRSEAGALVAHSDFQIALMRKDGDYGLLLAERDSVIENLRARLIAMGYSPTEADYLQGIF